MTGRDLLSGCYMTTRAHLLQKEAFHRDLNSLCPEQAKLPTLLCLLNKYLIQALETASLHTAKLVYRCSSYSFFTHSYPSMQTCCILSRDHLVYIANNLNTLYAFVT